MVDWQEMQLCVNLIERVLDRLLLFLDSLDSLDSLDIMAKLNTLNKINNLSGTGFRVLSTSRLDS